MCSFRFVLYVVSLVVLLMTPLSPAAHAQEEKPAERKFSLEINSVIDLSVAGKAQKITNATDLRYQWIVGNNAMRTLVLEQTGSRVMVDGKATLNAVVNRFGTAYVEDGKTLETKIADARSEVQTMLTDSYGPPICVVTVDKNGQVVKQDVVAKPGAKEQVDTGIIATCTLFHGPHFAEKEEWTRKTDISLGNGGFATGDLKFTRAKDFDAAMPRYEVIGTATNASYVWKDNPKLSTRNVKYDITGEQTYDPALGEWTSGTLTMKVQYKVYQEEVVASDHAGQMVFKFKLLTE